MSHNKCIQLAKSRISEVREKRLLYLDLSSLHLKSIPEDISDMVYLLDIDLSYNELREFPNSLSNLTNLQRLNLSNNLLQDLNLNQALFYTLQFLDISSNLLNHIPTDLLFNGAEILFDNNPFLDGLPVEISLSNDISYIQFYQEELKNRDNREKLFEIKLLIVGKGNVGKTTLIKVLANGDYKVEVGKESTTHGIDIKTINREILFPAKKPYYDRFSNFENIYFQETGSDFEIDDDGSPVPIDVSEFRHISEMDRDEDTLLSLRLEEQPFFYNEDIYFEKDISINVWDFGGQEILYSTHQFFLTQRSIYLLVWEPRADDEIDSFEYWLNTIQIVSDNSPVIVVMNKADIRVKLIDEEYYKRRFSNIMSFVEISCLNKTGIKDLNSEINNAILNLPHIGDVLPRSWNRIKKDLKEKSQDYLSLNEFKNICKSSNKKEVAYISKYLNDLGAIIHFQNDFYLQNLVVINPEWLTKAIYLLINSIKVQKNNGLFTPEILEELYDEENYPLDKFNDLLLLMEKFEICFKIIGSRNKYIIPTLLPPSIKAYSLVENFINDNKSLHFEIQYNFMPSGIIERLICRLNSYIKESNIWKYGLILNTENSEALIKSDINKRNLKIYIKGSIVTPLYNIILHEIKEIHYDIKIDDLDTEVHLACNCSECLHSVSPYMFKRRVLMNFIEKGKKHTYCQNSTEEVNIENILIGYKTDDSLKRSILRDLISSATTLQTRMDLIKDFKENQINLYFQDIFRSYLQKHNYFLNEQSLKGKSETGKYVGELDLTIETLEGEMITFFEGLILKNIDRSIIIRHISKTLLKYDSNGLKEKYIGVYCKAKNFGNFSIEYLNYLSEINIEGIIINNNIDVSQTYLGSSEMKIFKTEYFRSDTKLFLYHILINLN